MMKKMLLPLLLLQQFVCLMAAEPTAGYGFNSHLLWGDFASRDAQLAVIRKSGGTFARFDLLWYQAEPGKGVYDFRKLDALLDSCRKAGVEPILIIGGPYPSWISGNPANYIHEYTALVRAAVTHTKGRVRYFEIVNEPNRRTHWNGIPDAVRYAALLKAAYRTVKAANPDAVVVHGGLARVPVEFLASELDNGLEGCFDVVNVHPYSTQDFPEREIPDRMARLRKLLSKHGLAAKSIWATECGNPNGFVFPQKAFFQAALQKLKVKPEEAEMGYFADPSWRYFSRTINFDPVSLAKFRKITPLRMCDLAAFKGEILVLPPFRDFPAPYFAELLSFVRHGGILFSPFGAVPCTRFLEREGEGISMRKLTPKEEQQLSRMVSVRPQTVRYRGYRPAKGTALPEWKMPFSCAALDESKLDARDTMIPLLFAEDDKGKPFPIAGVYQFASDWRGALITGSVWLAENDETTTEAHQAELLARNVLLIKAGGADVVLVYNLTARENHPARGAHWGVLHKDLSPKPALAAFQTLAGECPAGATRPVVKEIGRNVWRAAWKTPDGKFHYALWRMFGRQTVTLRNPAAFSGIIDHLGRPVTVKADGKLELSEGPLYLSGPEKLELAGLKPAEPLAPAAEPIPDRR